MQTIYWIQVLGALSDVFIGFSLLLGLATCILIIMSTISLTESEGVEETYDFQRYKVLKKKSIITSIFFTISLLGAVFIPSKESIYEIYGIGGVIDYVKENDKTKQIPDKCINALDAWIDEITSKKEKE